MGGAATIQKATVFQSVQTTDSVAGLIRDCGPQTVLFPTADLSVTVATNTWLR